MEIVYRIVNTSITLIEIDPLVPSTVMLDFFKFKYIMNDIISIMRRKKEKGVRDKEDSGNSVTLTLQSSKDFPGGCEGGEEPNQNRESTVSRNLITNRRGMRARLTYPYINHIQ